MATLIDTRDRLLVVLSLFSPGAWVVFILVNYLLEDPLACMPGASIRGQILGIGVKTMAAGISLVLGSLTFAAALWSFVLWRRLRDTNSTGRRPWMALAGALNGVLFGTIILTGIAPAVLLRTCA
jgi:hypothetical protein